MSSLLPWEEGIIGKWERFFLKRFQIGPMWARALMTTLVSAVLSNLTLEDKKGPVKANIFVLYIGPSGLAYKTPLIRLMRMITKKLNPKLLSVSKFTPEGFTEWVMGVREKRDKDEIVQPGIPPHYANYIIRDEATKILRESMGKKYMASMKEYLSELWDGFIEAYFTRKMKLEGNVSVYVTLLSASSDEFLKLLEEGFFRQGIGNRILWIIENTREPEKLDPDTFFFGKGERDVELEQLVKETVVKLRRLQSLEFVFLIQKARELWVDYEYETIQEVRKDKGLEASFKIKQPLNALKLAMIYSASRLNASFDDLMLMVNGEDMQRAIEDTNKYFVMWEKAVTYWKRKKEERKQEKQPSSKYELNDFLEVAIRYKGLCSIGLIADELILTSRNQIAEVLAIGVRKEWLKQVAEQGEQGSLTDEEYKIFKPKRGPTPQIFRITEEGRKNYEKP